MNENLNRDSFVDELGSVAVRVSPHDVSRMFERPDGRGEYRAVAALNTATGSLSLAFSDKEKGANALRAMKELIGPSAKGDRSMAHSPEGVRRGLYDLEKLAMLALAMMIALHPILDPETEK